MRKRFFLSGVLLLVPLLAAGLAYAGGHSGHHHGDAVSPFEKQGLPVHCALMGHSVNKPCPHILRSTERTGSKPVFLSAGCEGSPGAAGGTGYDTVTPMGEIVPDFHTQLNATPAGFKSPFSSSSIPTRIEHPPRSV